MDGPLTPEQVFHRKQAQDDQRQMRPVLHVHIHVQVASFQSEGFLLLPGLLSPPQLAEVSAPAPQSCSSVVQVSAEYDLLFSRKAEEGGRLEAR